MIELSRDAAALVRRLRHEHGADAKAVMRVVVGPGRRFENLMVSFANRPGLGEDVGRSHDITISLEPGLSRALDGKVLGVIRTGEGEKLFLRLSAAGEVEWRPDTTDTTRRDRELVTTG
jgi:hypothetical protein